MKQLYTPKEAPMRVAAFMSGTGSNLRKILELQQEMGEKSPLRVVMIFTDTADAKKCNAAKIAEEYRLCYFCNDINDYYRAKNVEKGNREVRRKYDTETAAVLKEEDVDVVALCGYMSIVTGEICNRFLTVNVHPADLRRVDADGKRLYAGKMGAGAVMAAVANGDTELRSSTHIVTEGVDEGPVLMVSQPVKVGSGDANALLEELKQKGDWLVYPATLEMLARGAFGIDESNSIYVDGERVDGAYEHRG